MARKKKESAADALLNILALLPWWACVGIAVASYFILHGMAQPAAGVTPAQTNGLIVRSVMQGLATAGQYIVPFIALLAAAMSAIGKRQRNRLVDDVVAANSTDALGNMSWREFETLVGESFRLQGFRVEENHVAGPDGGIDLVLRKGSEKFLVQCKQWRAYKVGVQVVRELYGVMAAQGAAGGYVVTSGRFTGEAVEFASGRNVQLLDGPKLANLLHKARASSVGRSKTATAMPELRLVQGDGSRQGASSEPSADAAPSCPVCGTAMVKREARRGANAGNAFWGCRTYPSCKGTRALP